jgi:hypothetical protein
VDKFPTVVIIGAFKKRPTTHHIIQKEEDSMKKLFLLLVAVMLIAGCTSEFYKHDRVFATNSHVAYSWWGYKDTGPVDAKKSAEQGWWGKEIPYVPAK